MIKNILYGIIGMLTTNIVVSLLDFIQGLILDDWSGVHPKYRLLHVPIYFIISLVFGLLIVIIFGLLKRSYVASCKESFKIGMILGLIGFSDILRPWIGSNEYTESIVFLAVFCFGAAAYIRYMKNSDVP
jgi:hypothetical protein